ncbi:hypothetical protein Tco_0733412 [Tanacetum coccineum]
MEAETTSTTLTAKLLILNPGDYDLWLMRIEQYFLMTAYPSEVIKKWYKVLKEKLLEKLSRNNGTYYCKKKSRHKERNESSSELYWMALLNNINEVPFI